jgi:hypothetical protein
MRNLLIALAGFVVGGALIAGVAFAVPHYTTVTMKPAAAQGTAMPMAGGMGVGTRGQSSMMARSLATRRLTIQHVQKGCHIWSNGKTTAAMMRLRLQPGQKLSILDMDVDAHQMMQFAGPARLRMGGPMMMNKGMTLSFMKKGIYRLGTRTVEMPGGGMEVKTIGPDNRLRLVVTVA